MKTLIEKDKSVSSFKVYWDPTKLKEVEKAKKVILEYKDDGCLVLKKDGSLMANFEPYHGEALVLLKKEKRRSIMRILSEVGDEVIEWSSKNSEEALKAKEEFKEKIRNGYRAFSKDSENNKGMEITEFDVEAQEIIMVPPTVRG